jgi:DNA-binding NarL/FixJ family response regulator
VSTRQFVSLLPIVLPALSLLISSVCVFMLLKTRGRVQTLVTALNYSDSEVVELSKDLDTVSKRSADLSRRIDMIESRRTSEVDENSAEQAGSTPVKLTMTERRHRIRVLARKGKNAESIAATLGMPYGEVQLIMGLTANA